MKLSAEEWACQTAAAVAPNDAELQLAIAMAVFCRMKGWKRQAGEWVNRVRSRIEEPTPSQREFLEAATQWEG